MLPYRVAHPCQSSPSPTSSDTDAASSGDATRKVRQQSSFHRFNNVEPYRAINVNTRTTRPFRSNTVNPYRNRNTILPREELNEDNLLAVPRHKLRQESPKSNSPRRTEPRDEASLPFQPYLETPLGHPEHNDPHDEEDAPLSPTTSFKSSVRTDSPTKRHTAPNIFVQYEPAPRFQPRTSFTPYTRDMNNSPDQRPPTASLGRRTFARSILNRDEDPMTKLEESLRRASSITSIRRQAVGNREEEDVASVEEEDESKLRRTTTGSYVTGRRPESTSFHRTTSSRLVGTTSFNRGQSTSTLRRARPSLLLGSRLKNATENKSQAPLLENRVPLPRRGSLERLPPRIPRSSSAARDIRQKADSVKTQLSSMFGGEQNDDIGTIPPMPTLRRSSLCSLPSSEQAKPRARVAAFRSGAIRGVSSFALRRRRDEEKSGVMEFASNPSLHRKFSENASVRSTVLGR